MYTATSMLAKARSNNYLPENRRLYYRNVYLKSDHWKSIREDKLNKNGRCEKCGTTNSLDVHHVNYRGLYDVKLEDLKTLCRICHEKEHQKLDKKKHKRLPRSERRLKRKMIRGKDGLEKAWQKLNQLRSKRIYLSARNEQRQKKFDKTFNYEFKDMNTYVSIHY